jgi:CBS domain-containing protein
MIARDPATRLSDLATAPARTAAPDATVRAVTQMMSSYDIGLVVIEDDDIPVGVVSERDVVRGLTVHDEYALVGSYLDSTAGDIMSADPITAGAATTVADALEVMSEHGVRHLLVPTPEGHSVVSIRDLF